MPHLRDLINDRNTPMKLKVHSGNKIIDLKSQFGEWKIQLTMQLNFIFSKEIRTMRTKNDNIEIMMGEETNDIIKEHFDFFCEDIKKDQKKK